jgi:diguanylate cyclase (GGDEF)-like protein/PAS domain S-box-containing protein
MASDQQGVLLRAMNEVYRYLLTENDLPNLLQGICDRLVTKGLFVSSLIVFIDEATGSMITAETGFADRFQEIMEPLREGVLPPCGLRVLKDPALSTVFCRSEKCIVCNTFPERSTCTGICTAIRSTPALYGFVVVHTRLSVGVGKSSILDMDSFSQVGEAVAHALRQLFDKEDAKHREEEMRLVEERYELALLASQAGLWDWNIQTGEMYTSPNQKEYLDYRSGNGGPGPTTRVIHPDDKDKVLSILNEHLEGESDEYRIEYRVKDIDGEWAWYLDRGRVVERDDKNMPVRMTGTHQNITLQKHREQALAAIQQQLHDTVDHERNFLQTVIDSAGDPVMVVDLQYNIMLINRPAVRLSNASSSGGSMQGRKCYELFCNAAVPCTDERFPCPLAAILEKSEQVKLIHNPYHGNGINNTFELDVSPLRNAAGQLYGIIEVARDVTDRLRIEDELRDSQSKLYRLAHHDTLTGLPNRLLFRDRLNQALIKASRIQKSVAVMYLDLDRFKQINDTLGHDVGDDLLVEVADRLKQQCRASDTVARLGGDEFVFVLDGIGSKEDVAVIAEKIVAVMQEQVSIKEHVITISTSIGIALYPDDSSIIDGVIKFADMALYKAKEKGRNTFCFYQSSIEDVNVDPYNEKK